jgi:tetratricopeptide (TPR) repeat protein
LLARASAAESGGQLDRAALYLSRYLEFEPADVEERARLGRILASKALAASRDGRARARLVLEQVLGRDPDRHDCRRLLVRVALDGRNLDLAREHLKILAGAQAGDAETDLLHGRYHALQGQYDEAIVWYRRAVQNGSTAVDVHQRLAELLRKHAPPGQQEEYAAEADQVMDRLVAQNGQSVEARLARWRYRKGLTDLRKDEPKRAQAAEDVVKARELAPDDPAVIAAVADLAQAEGKPDEARKELTRGLEQHPQDLLLLRALAALEMEAGHRQAARDVLHKALKKAPAAAQTELRWALAHLLIEGPEQEQAEAETVIAQMRRGPASAPAADYLEGRLRFVQGNFSEAARLLERARPSLENTPDVIEQIDLTLGRSYEKLGDPVRQAAACDRLIKHAPASLAARLGLAAAEAAQGHFDNAVENYRQGLALPGAPPEVRFEIVRLLILRDVTRGTRNGRDVVAALAEADKAHPGSPDLALLRAEFLAVHDKLNEARSILEAACARDAECKRPDLRLALAAVLDRQGEGGKALALLDEVQNHADTADLRVARARYWSKRKPEEAREPLARLVQGLDTWNAADQARVLRAVSEAHARHGSLREAAVVCDRLARLPGNENDARLRLLLCELALRNDDPAALQQALADLQRIEGEGLHWSVAEGLRLIAEARKGKVEGLTRARALLERAEAARPAWPALLLARAEVAELQGHPEEAIEHYRKVNELGERSPWLTRRLVELLYRQQRYREADEEIRQLEHQSPARDVQLLAADLSLRNQDPGRAVRLALGTIPPDSPNHLDQLWLGQMLAGSGKHAQEAERHLRRAVALAGQAPETWVALVRFLAGQKRRDEAQKVIEEAQGKLPPAAAPLALAPCYEAIDRADLAEEAYRAALKIQPESMAVARGVATFYLRTLRPLLAEAQLRRIIDGKLRASAADVAWARTGMAMVLASRGPHSDFVEALKFVGLGLDPTGKVVPGADAGEDSIERRRAQARVLATRPIRAMREKAIALLEGLHPQRALLPGDRFLLSQLYEATDNWDKAGTQLQVLLEAHDTEPLYLNRATQNLLRRGKTVEAARMLERLQKVEQVRGVKPGAFGTVDLRARLLEASSEGGKAAALLTAYAAREGARPEDVLLVIGSLARQQRYDEAVALAEKAWPACPGETLAPAHVGVLRVAKKTGEPCTRAEQLLTAALRRTPEAPALLLALADLEDLRGRYAQAEEYYRRALRKDANSVVALNNLAWLLSQRGGKGEEALPLINRAIELLGRRPDLLDTRALVYLTLNQPERARADLEESIADTPTAARYFHLARAHDQGNDAEARTAALTRARELKLERGQLHPVEQLACAKLLEQLEGR